MFPIHGQKRGVCVIVSYSDNKIYRIYSLVLFGKSKFFILDKTLQFRFEVQKSFLSNK